MPALKTSQEVIQATGVAGLADYYDVIPLLDAAGFTVKRRYPLSSAPAQVVKPNGAPACACVIAIAVEPPQNPNGVSRVGGEAWLYEDCQEDHRLRRHNFGNPNCPTEATYYAFQAAAKPQEVHLAAGVLYDCAASTFHGANGPFTGQQILDSLYDAHLATLQRGGRLRLYLARAWRHLVRWGVWRGQDACLRLLEYGYDVKATPQQGSPFSAPFRIYKWKDFVRSSDMTGSHFFGFQSSKRSLFSNMIVLCLIIVGAYWLLPHAGLLRAIYGNTVLSTVVVVFVFLVVDQLLPRALEGIVWTLCRLRLRALFF